MNRTAEVAVVATDLDGTLLRSDRTVSARTAAAMAAADAVGIKVVWATARARHSIDELAASCGFRGTAIGANGAVVLDLADGTASIVGTRSIPPETVESAKAVVRSLVPGVAFATVGATRFVAEARYAELCVFADHHRHPHDMELSEFGLPADVEPTVKIVARHSITTSEAMYELLSAAGVGAVELTHSGAPYIEMSAAGVSKASALQDLCKQWGVSSDSVAAVGDARNDLPMLAWAGTALCPSNAAEPVRVVADRILESNDDDAVARFLEELTARRTTP